MLLKDHWYIACPTSRLTDDAPYAVQIGEDKLVVFRDSTGVPHTLLDRCCHRGVQLSLGRINKDNLACGYHGWQFDGGGKLVHIPSLSADTETPAYSVPAYPTLEKDHYVWVWMAGEHAAPTYTPSLLGLEDGGNWVQQTAFWNVHVMDAVENQLDVAHTPFSHPGIYPGHTTESGVIPPLTTFEMECRIRQHAVDVFGPPVKQDNDPVPSWQALGFWARYELPYRNYVFLTTQGIKAIYNWVPLSAGRCRLEFMSAVPSQGKTSGSKTAHVNFMEGELELLSQDRILLESATTWATQGRQGFERSILTDFPQLQARRLNKAALEGRLNDTLSPADKRKVFTITA